MKSKAESEAILKLWLIYKKTIPNNQMFYYIFFLFKYYPIFLLTHNLKGLENDNFSFETLFRKMLLFSEATYRFYVNYFPQISVLIYIVLLFVLFTLVVIVYSYQKYAKTNKHSLYDVPSNKYTIPKGMKLFTKFASWLLLVVVFFNQFISEHLYLGIFMLYFNQNNNQFNTDTNIKEFDSRLGGNKYVYGVLNIIFYFILFVLLMVFFFLTNSRSISQKYGFKTMNSSMTSFIIILLFQSQGIYSTCRFYSETLRNQTRLILCCITTVILLLQVYFLSKLSDFNSMFVFLIKLIQSWCLIAGCIEIVLYFVLEEPMSQKMTLIKTVIEFINALILTNVLINYRRRLLLDLFSRSIFDEKESILADSFMEYFYMLYTHTNGQDNFLQLYSLFQKHHQQCPNESCQCYRKLRKCQSLPVNKQKAFLNEVFIAIGEVEILQTILNHENKKQLEKLHVFLLLHVDYLFSIKRNYFQAFYLTHYYFEMKASVINVHYRQPMYEIRHMILQKFKTKKKVRTKILKGDVGVRKPTILSSRTYMKTKGFIEREVSLEIIRKLVLNCCVDLREIMAYKESKNQKKKITFSCENVIESIRKHKENRTHLIEKIDKFFEKNAIESIEMSFILHTLFILSYGEIPSKYYNKLNVHLASNYLRDIKDDMKSNFFILFLTNESRLLIRYASLLLTERLSYTHNELINTEFPGLLPYFIAKYHFAYIKHFLANGLLTYNKTTYVQSKDKHLVPLKVKCKALPTQMSLAMIVKVDEGILEDVSESIFHAIVDDQFSFQSISKEFENYFYFSLKIFHAINIDLCQLLGLNPDVISAVFKNKIKELKKKRLITQRKEKFFYPLLTSIKPEEHFIYRNVSKFKKRRKSLVNCMKINKSKAYKAIWLLQKYIEESGLEKEWATKIQELYSKLSIHGPDLGKTITNGNNTFLIKFELKAIGDLIYYIVVIQDSNSPRIDTMLIEEEKDFVSSKVFQNQSCGLLLDNDTHYLGGSTQKSNQSFNDSKATLINPKSSFVSKRKGEFNMKFTADLSEVSTQSKKMLSISFVLRICYFILFGVLLCLNILNALLNSEILSDSKTLYYINLYSFLLNCDIYLGGLLCLRNCFISNLIQPGEMHEPALFKQSGTEIIEHYHQLLKYINKMINKDQIQSIYELLYQSHSYYLLLPNWDYMERTDSIGEEIYFIYYTMSKFEPQKEADCRIKELFYNGLFKESPNYKPGDINSVHERFIFYILSNSMKRIGPLIQRITSLSNQILLDYHSSSRLKVIYFNVGILLTGLLLYLLMVSFVMITQEVFRSEFLYLFEYQDNEEEYSNEIANFQFVIENFNRKEVLRFEQLKLTGTKRNSLSSMKTKKEPSKAKKKDKKEKKAPSHLDIDKEEEMKKREERTFAQLTRLKVVIVTIVMIMSSFFLFTGIQFGYIFFILNSYDTRMIETKLTINFFSRVPRMAELFLYSSVSAIFNNVAYMEKDPSEYDSEIISNFYQIKLDVNSHSLFSIMERSQYSFIYYQLFILRQNILRLLNDQSKTGILKETTDLEKLLYQEDSICVYSPLYYIRADFTGKAHSTLSLIFSEVSRYASQCRSIGEGINQNGITMMFESFISELTAHYQNFYGAPVAQRDITSFLAHKVYVTYGLVLQTSLKIIHHDNAFTAELDMETSDAFISSVEIIFTITTLLMSCGFIFVILFVFISKIKENRSLLNDFIDHLEKALRSYKVKRTERRSL